jgi:tetratricopeptide (TPR) repeat protein
MSRYVWIVPLLFSAVWMTSAARFPQQAVPANAPPDPAPMLADALSLYRKGSWDQALARYNDVLKSDAHSGEAYAGIIRCYLKQDKVREADDALQKGLQSNPANPDLKVAEGELLFRQGEIPEAGKLFDEVIVTPPDPAQPKAPPNARAYLGAARVASANAMYSREHILIARAHALDASDPEIRRLWTQTLSSDESIEPLEEYLARPSNDDEATRRRLRARLDFLKAARFEKEGRCRPVSDVTATSTTLRSISLSNGSWQGNGLDVVVNGKQSLLLLDTGASGILITSKLASLAGLKPVSQISMGGIGDRPDTTAQIAYAESVQIGDMKFQNCPLYIVEGLPPGTDGIIGTDVFANFLIELDFPSSTLRLSELPTRPGDTPVKAGLSGGDNAGAESETKPSESTPQSHPASRYLDRYIAPEMRSYVQAFRVGHFLLIPTTIGEHAQKLFLLDTGSFDNTISTAAGQEVSKIHRAPRIEVRGMKGSVKKVYVAERVTLDFGHLRQTVPNMVAIDMAPTSRQVGTEVSGTLGIVMLRMLKIRLDYRDALADFQYVQKPPRR